jgi:riboflavin transporter FmnP
MGPVFLPMHIPVLIAGLFLGGFAGLVVGVLTPFLSSLLTGMPPLMPTLPVMAVELAVYGAIGGCLHKIWRWNLYVSLATAMVAGRLAAAMMVYVLANMLNITVSPVAYVTGAFVTAFQASSSSWRSSRCCQTLQAVFVKYACKE